MRCLEEERQQKEDRKELERRKWQAEFQQEMEMKRQEHELKILKFIYKLRRKRKGSFMSILGKLLIAFR